MSEIIRRPCYQKYSKASWKTSAHTHALPHTLTHVLRNPCVVLQCHTQQIPSTDKISHRLDKRKTQQEKNLFTLLSVIVCVIAKTCKCLCHKLPKSQLNVSKTSRWMLSQPCALPTRQNLYPVILLTHALLSSFARKLWGRGPVPPAGFHFQYCGVTGG